MATVMELVVLSLLLLNFTPLSAYNRESCKIPPQFWCDSEEVANKCGVLEQCKQNEWRKAGPDAEKVDFVVYYESLCPDCQRFITSMLYPNFDRLSSIMNLTLVPYGNAYEKKVGNKWVFSCQHGEQECIGNLIDTCTITLVKDINKYFPFINCMEASSLKPVAAAKKCAIQFTVPLDDILNCTQSDYGNKLEHEMAVKTDALQPPHRYVPWVTLNGVHTEAIEKAAEGDLVKLICDTYKGPKPAVCK